MIAGGRVGELEGGREAWLGWKAGRHGWLGCWRDEGTQINNAHALNLHDTKYGKVNR